MIIILRTYRNESAGRRGMALVIAISLLALFSTLGMLYVRRMNLEVAHADILLAEARARQAATAGVQAALAELERALDKQQHIHQLFSKPKRYDFPVYSGALADGTPTREASDRRRAYANVTIADENAKVNLNHAPASVLQMILGVDGATARAIAASLPRGAGFAESDEEAHRQWLLDPGDLVARGLLTPEQYEDINPAHVTTCSVPDHSNPVGFININTAPAEVMAAVLDVSVEDARKVITRRPFRTLAALAAAAGKDPATFNIRPDPREPAALPAPLAIESHCFQIVSEAVCATVAGKQEHDKVHARVEAIVYFPPEGGHEIVRWNARRGA